MNQQPEAASILIVDDDQIMAELLGIWLEDAGYVVVRAVDAPTALSMFGGGGPFTAVVCDFDLGRTTGCSLVAELAELQPGLALVMISGHPEHRVRAECLTDGVQFLQKPFDPAELVRLIDGGSVPRD